VPSLSVLTATTLAHERHAYLMELAEAIHELSKLVSLEWLVLIDGREHAHPEIVDLLEGVPGTRVITDPQRGGLFTARNRLACSAESEYVYFIDDDDVPLPPAIATALDIAEQRRLAWVCGGVAELFPDGSTADFFPVGLAFGHCMAGDLMRAWQASLDANPTAACPLLITGGIFRRQALLDVGGFPAMRQAADLATVMRVTSAFDGWLTDAPLFLYRVHPDQWTRSSDWWTIEEQERKLVHLLAQPVARGNHTPTP